MKYLLLIISFLIPVFASAQLRPDQEAAKPDDGWVQFSKTEPLEVTFDDAWKRSLWAESLNLPIGMREFYSKSAARLKFEANRMIIEIEGVYPENNKMYPIHIVYLINDDVHRKLHFTFAVRTKLPDFNQKNFDELYKTLGVKTLTDASANKADNSKQISILGDPMTLEDYFVSSMILLEKPRLAANLTELLSAFGNPTGNQKIFDKTIYNFQAFDSFISVTMSESGVVEEFNKI